MSVSTGTTPRPDDTPRTRHRKELRSRRLAFFGNNQSSVGNGPQSITTIQPDQHLHGNDTNGNNNCDPHPNILQHMKVDSRVRSEPSPKGRKKPVRPSNTTVVEPGLDQSPGTQSTYAADLQCMTVKDIYIASNRLLSENQQVADLCTIVGPVETRGHTEVTKQPSSLRTHEQHVFLNGQVNDDVPFQNGFSDEDIASEVTRNGKLNGVGSCSGSVLLQENKVENSTKRKGPSLRQEGRSEREGHSGRNGSSARNGNQERCNSPSKQSSVSNFTLSSVAASEDDDLTNVTELGLSTHRPSQVNYIIQGRPNTGRSIESDEQTGNERHISVAYLKPDINHNHFIPEDISGLPVIHHISDEDEVPRASNDFDPKNLREVLGEEKFRRLMKNFEDVDDDRSVTGGSTCNWFADDEEGGTEINNISTVKSKYMYKGEQQIDPQMNGIEGSGALADELELKTHRPLDSSEVASVQPAEAQSKMYSTCYTDSHTEALGGSGTRNYVQVPSVTNIKCSYSVGEIYAVAGEINDIEQPRNSRVCTKKKDAAAESSVLTDTSSALSLPDRSKSKNLMKESAPIPVHEIKTNEKQQPAAVHHGTKESDIPPIGNKDTNESLQRYFDSLKSLNMLPGETSNFDPVPDPEILHSPNRGRKVSGQKSKKEVNLSSKYHVNYENSQDRTWIPILAESDIQKSEHNIEPKAVDCDDIQMVENPDTKSVRDPDDLDCSSSLATTKLLRPLTDIDVEQIQRMNVEAIVNAVTGKCQVPSTPTQPEHSSIKAQKQGTDSQNTYKTEPAKREVHISHFIAPKIPAPESSSTEHVDDEAVSRVTTNVTGLDNVTGLTERMEKLGINFDLVRKNSGDLPASSSFVQETVKVKTINDPPGSADNLAGESASISGKALSTLPEKCTGEPQASSAQVRREKKLKAKVRVCPECASVNRPYMDWCTDCGGIMIGVEPVPVQQRKVEQKRVKEFLEDEVSHSPKDVPAVQASKDTDNSDVRDSDTFVYEQSAKPGESLSHHLRAELSLNLRSSTSTITSISNTPGPSSKPKTKSKPSKKQRNAEDLAEDIEFVYSEEETPTHSVPNALRAELLLNLRDSMDSQKSANYKVLKKSKKHPKKSKHKNREIPEEQDLEEKKSHHREVHVSPPLLDASRSPAPEIGESDDAQEQSDVPGGQQNDQQLVGQVQEEASAIDESYKDFLNRLVHDSRFQPSKSSKGPKKSNSGHKNRPQSAGRRTSIAQSKVRQSLEKESYPRRWQTSSVAWSSYKPGALSKPSSLQPQQTQRPSSAKVNRTPITRPASSNGRPASAHGRPSASMTNAQKVAWQVLGNVPDDDSGSGGEAGSQMPSSSKARSPAGGQQQATAKSADPAPATAHRAASRQDGRLLTVQAAPYKGAAQAGIPAKSASASLGTMAKYMSLSPRIHDGELSMLLCLPEELLLYIFAFLKHGDLIKCAQVCTHIKRIAMDKSLWKKITLKKTIMTDEWLVEIGSKQPTSLSLIQCHGEQISANGLREMFRQCSESLVELNCTGCTRGRLTGDHILLHAASRCRNITHLDVSWTNIEDHGLMDIASSLDRLESLCVNGCQVISDEAIRAVVVKHGLYLQTLELFGCFNLTQTAIICLMNHCKGLVTLNLGQCWKLTETCISQLTASLGLVENLDLRGCKQLKDVCVHHLVRNCPRLVTLAIANCPAVTDAALANVASLTSNLRSLDICGCKQITDNGVKLIASGCPQLEYLDISSTKATQKSVTSVASYCNRRLEVFKVNFCKVSSSTCLVRLVKNCKRLKKLYLYGVTCIRNSDEIQPHNPYLWIEM